MKFYFIDGIDRGGANVQANLSACLLVLKLFHGGKKY
jgi:hypothetical protein